MKIAVDFDGTCVKHMYPDVGDDCPGAVEVLRALADAGHAINLFTMRSGEQLEDAKDWFKAREIPLSGINKDEGQEEWTASPKCYAQLYIDDAALGAPLVRPHLGRPFVDWQVVGSYLVYHNIIPRKVESYRWGIQTNTEGIKNA